MDRIKGFNRTALEYADHRLEQLKAKLAEAEDDRIALLDDLRSVNMNAQELSTIYIQLNKTVDEFNRNGHRQCSFSYHCSSGMVMGPTMGWV